MEIYRADGQLSATDAIARAIGVASLTGNRNGDPAGVQDGVYFADGNARS